MSEPKKVEIEIGAATIKGAAIIKDDAPGDTTAADVDTAKQVVVGKDNTQTDTAGGAATQGNVVADRFTGRDDQRNYADHRSGNVTFQNPDNAVLLTAIFAVKDQVSGIDKSIEATNKKVDGLDLKIDDMPARLRVLELRVPWATWILLAVIVGGAVLAAVFFAGRLSM